MKIRLVMMFAASFIAGSFCPNSSYSGTSSEAKACNGRYQSKECHYVLWTNDCKSKISVDWVALKIPGTKDLQRSKRNWCSVVFENEAVTKEKKLLPTVCDNLMKFMDAAKKGLPEIEWQDTPCTHLTGKDGVLYLEEENPSSIYAVRLADARGCKLEAEVKPADALKNRQVYRDAKTVFTLRCPVLPDRSFAWLNRFSAQIGVNFKVQNDLK